MSYQVLARKYRPQYFRDVLGQRAIVATLKQALQKEKLGHAYIFSGPHGTGKTTLARLFAKAINCAHLSKEMEPCNECQSCKEIAGSHSLDVLEIDGASHRSIEDIRRINETLAYRAPSGKKKIYLIDEVHMLTKEAFNALLKSLEEPPSHVHFFFCTTEPHALPSTIVSRCQRFHLKRMTKEEIHQKLKRIALECQVEVEEEVYTLLAHLSEGGLRDAESLFDQLIAYGEGTITLHLAQELFGLTSREHLLALDQAIQKRDIAAMLVVLEELFKEGKSLYHFIEEMMRHYRSELLGGTSGLREDRCLQILSLLATGLQEIKSAPSKRLYIEALFLRLLQLYHAPTLEELLVRLEALEGKKTLLPPVVEEKMEEKSSVQPPVVVEEKKEAVREEAPYSQARVDTLIQFAAKELGGKIKK